jgi:selenide,water dikinase
VTGFGLLGHSYEMADGSGVELKIYSSKVPLMENVIDLIRRDSVPGGAYSNMDYFGKWVEFDESVPEPNKIALFDPQTSGGLLISVPEEKAEDLLNAMRLRSVSSARIIGEVLEKGTQERVIRVMK